MNLTVWALVFTCFIFGHSHVLICTYICRFHSLLLQLENDLREIETSFFIASFYSEKFGNPVIFNMVIPAFQIEGKHVRTLCKVSKSKLPIFVFHPCLTKHLFTWRKSKISLFLPHGCIDTDKGLTTRGFGQLRRYDRKNKLMDGLVHKIGMESSRLIIP